MRLPPAPTFIEQLARLRETAAARLAGGEDPATVHQDCLDARDAYYQDLADAGAEIAPSLEEMFAECFSGLGF